MATPVGELELPFVSIDPARRGAESAGAGESAWLYETELGLMLSRHADVLAVLSDRRWHNELTPLVTPDSQMERWLANRQAGLLSLDGDDHLRLRRAVMPWLTPQRIEGFRASMRETFRELLDTFIAKGGGDFISEVSAPYARRVIFDLVGASSAWRERFGLISDERIARGITTASPARDVIEISEAFDDLVGELIDDPEPARVASLLEVLRLGESDGTLSRAEAVMLIENVIGGGAGSTLAQLGSAVHLFARFEAEFGLLRRQPELAAQAVEEVLRFRGAARGATRIAAEEIEYREVLFPRNTTILLSFDGANRDPTAFSRANRFDISRRDEAAQISFGHGAHFCIGAALARAELTEALTVLATRVDRIELTGDVTWGPPAADFWGPAVLPVRFYPA